MVAPDRRDEALVGSLVTSLTPFRPRAVRSRKNCNQPAPSSAVVTLMPRTSRYPSTLMPGGDQCVHPGNPATFPDLEDQGVSGDERVRALIEPAVPERLDLGVEFLGHGRDLRLRQS